jgi:Flp pilus assembly pilin Flp
MHTLFTWLWRDQEGLTTVEYSLLLVLIVVVAVTAWTTLGANVTGKVSSTANVLA